MRITDTEVERYARQLVLHEIGGAGQQALKRARVLVVGLGGLGLPAAAYLAGAGVGRLGLVDPDTVAVSNLHRQILFQTADIGLAKTDVAAARLLALNPYLEIDLYPERFEAAADIVGSYDVVLDGTDSFPTRFAVNAACILADRPLVSGAIGRWHGQVGVFRKRPCYRCLVPQVPPEAEACAEVGVVGPLPGVIGAIMAMEAIKLIAGAGAPLDSRLLLFDGLTGASRTVHIMADPACPACAAAP